MQNYFNNLIKVANTACHSKELCLLSISGEYSDFVRFNQCKIRQAGSVEQAYLNISLISNQRQCNHSFSLSHNHKQDSQKIIEIIASLRNTLSVLPEDPHILYNSENKSSNDVDTSALTESKTICEEILTQGKSLDLVGFLANGTIYHGFANSRGQKNWFETNLFSFDWSLYEKEDKAIKSQYSGKTWDEQTFHKKFEHAKLQAQLIKNEYKTIEPGSYRVYLAPSAFAEIIELLCWDGFSGKSFSTKTSSLQLVFDKKKQLSNNFTISQKNSNKTSPTFDNVGFVYQNDIVMIKQGIFNNALYSPRSAAEYQTTPNCPQGERPSTIEVSPGHLNDSNILTELDNGIYINNLWYLNYSDHSRCRITGMTRFGCFLVENGAIKAPINVMRFDVSALDFLGTNLLSVGSNLEFILNRSTYRQRSTQTMKLPGILVDNFTFTL